MVHFTKKMVAKKLQIYCTAKRRHIFGNQCFIGFQVEIRDWDRMFFVNVELVQNKLISV